mgnify:CR=1 FL=1
MAWTEGGLLRTPLKNAVAETREEFCQRLQKEIWSDPRSGHGWGVEEGWVCGLGGVNKCFRARKLGFSEEYNPLCVFPSYLPGLDDE